MDGLFKGASEAAITAMLGTNDESQNHYGLPTWRRQRGAEGGWSLINVGGFQLLMVIAFKERMFVECFCLPENC